MARLLWRITKDCLGDEPSAVGRGTMAAMEDVAATVAVRDGVLVCFRLYDDDNILYYEGIMTASCSMDEAAFEPLDWAAANAGCTRIDICRDGKWETL